MHNVRIERIEWGRLTGERPRKAGCNSRLGEHGLHVSPSIARITTFDGVSGFGRSHCSKEVAESLVGFHLNDAFEFPENWEQEGARGKVPQVKEAFRMLEYPLWDLLGQLEQKPVYAVLLNLKEPLGKHGSFRVPCYDTSLYIDDLHLEDDDEAAALIASEALAGAARGHTAFKIKVGRGAMHMPLEKGTQRDIRVIKAVREAVGRKATILIDANNGYNLNLTKRVLSETADADVYWMEEAFHEDARLYSHLKAWLNAEGLKTKIADGEGGASPHLLQWAEEGLVDIVQYDIFHPGFTRWLELGPQLDDWNVGTAPHHYGGYYGNFATGHLAAKIDLFQFVEWDHATVPGIDDSVYTIVDGYIQMPALPGFGLSLDETLYQKAVEENGFMVCAPQKASRFS